MESLCEKDCWPKLSEILSLRTEIHETVSKDASEKDERVLDKSSSNLCLLCNSYLSLRSSLRRHYLTQHEYDPKKADDPGSGEEFKCRDCEESFAQSHALIRHALQVHHTVAKRFHCEDCGKSYGYNKDLKYHTCSSSKEGSSCEICGKTSLHNLSSHKTFAHICRYCPFVSSDRKAKLKHIKETHAEKEPCPKGNCGYTFPPGSQALESHLINYHAPEKESIRNSYAFTCDICFLKIKSLKHLEMHKKFKHDPDSQTASCPFCEYRVPIKRKNDIYRYHIKRIHPEQRETWESYEKKIENWKTDFAKRAKVQCYLCSYAGSKRSNMPRHYVDVHGYDKDYDKKADAKVEDDPDGALCPECGEHFRNRHSLIAHLLKVHSKSTGEQCLYCSFRYYEVEEHINSVHGEEKAKTNQFCLKCVPKQSFDSFEDLLRHTRSYHRKILKTRTKKTMNSKNNRLCENCGKKVGSTVTMSRHRAECKKLILAEQQQRSLLMEDEEEYFDEELRDAVAKSSKRYVPVHLSGICPYCQYKFSDLLGHIRHGHRKEKNSDSLKTSCTLCKAKFNSIRELVNHRQLHPTFVNHICSKCKGEFESVVELRVHRKDCGGRRGKKKTEAKVEQSRFPSSIIEYEGRGTVPCHICKKSFTLKTLLRRHYMGTHNYDPRLVNPDSLSNSGETCRECHQSLANGHAVIKHYLDFHAVISGQICPYCDSKWSRKKFDDLDSHVRKYHLLEMQSPIQTCSTCKTNFTSYEDLKHHRQLHEGGNRRLSEFTDSTTDPNLIVHSRVGAYSEIGNKGGVKCQLCNAFKIRKEHLKIHYIKHHGYDPKMTANIEPSDEDPLECPVCMEFFPNNHFLIKHLLKSHCSYTGLICPYCTGHFPERFIGLQTHVTAVHMDWLTGYNVSNKCKVCRKTFAGYAELRDHVQSHGDAYRDPYGNPEMYRANRKLKVQNKKKEDEERRVRQTHEELMLDIEEARLIIDDAQDNNLPQGSPKMFFDLMSQS